MDTDVFLRAIDKKEIQTVIFLARQIWPTTYQDILGPEQLDYMMKLFYSEDALAGQMEEGHRFFLLEKADEPLGFASVSRLAGTTIFKLHKIYVLPGLQGLGLGKFMLDSITEKIKNENASAIQLNVNRHNKAKQFYDKLGFKVIREEDIDIGNNYFMNDFVMEKTWSPDH